MHYPVADRTSNEFLEINNCFLLFSHVFNSFNEAEYTGIVMNILCLIRCIVERRQLPSSDFHFSEAKSRALMLCMWMKRQNLYSFSQFWILEQVSAAFNRSLNFNMLFSRPYTGLHSHFRVVVVATHKRVYALLLWGTISSAPGPWWHAIIFYYKYAVDRYAFSISSAHTILTDAK